MYNLSGIAKGPTKHQRTKWLICECLAVVHWKDHSATCKELEYDIFMLSLGSIRSCCSRMSTGYVKVSKPRYKRHYLHKLHYLRPAVYKLLSKGNEFLIRIGKEHPDDVATWTNELINSRKFRDIAG